MNSILQELYFGNVPGCERHANNTAEGKAVNQKIHDEKQYFSGVLSEEDCKRLIELDDMYRRSNSLENMHTFIYAFRLGVMLMCDVFMNYETDIGNGAEGAED
jgi:hypothetical protein